MISTHTTLKAVNLQKKNHQQKNPKTTKSKQTNKKTCKPQTKGKYRSVSTSLEQGHKKKHLHPEIFVLKNYFGEIMLLSYPALKKQQGWES